MGKGGKRGSIVSAKGGLKKSGKKRKEEDGKGKIPQSKKGWRIRGLFWGTRM